MTQTRTGRRQHIRGTIGPDQTMDLSAVTIACEGDAVVIRRGRSAEVRVRVVGQDTAEVDVRTDGTILPCRVPREGGR